MSPAVFYSRLSLTVCLCRYIVASLTDEPGTFFNDNRAADEMIADFAKDTQVAMQFWTWSKYVVRDYC